MANQRTWMPPPLTEHDMVDPKWRAWWKWSSTTQTWTRHERQEAKR